MSKVFRWFLVDCGLLSLKNSTHKHSILSIVSGGYPTHLLPFTFYLCHYVLFQRPMLSILLSLNILYITLRHSIDESSSFSLLSVWWCSIFIRFYQILTDLIIHSLSLVYPEICKFLQINWSCLNVTLALALLSQCSCTTFSSHCTA